MGTEVVKSAAKAQRAAIDEKLLRGARTSSLTELSEETGLTPQEVAERMTFLLEDKGWLTDRMEERLVLIELGDLITVARERLSRVADKDFGTVGKIITEATKQLSERFDARFARVDADIEKITQAHARLFGRSFDVAIEHVKNGVLMLTSDITDRQLEDLVDEGLALADKVLQDSVEQ